MRSQPATATLTWLVCSFAVLPFSHTAEQGQPVNPSDPIVGRAHWAFRPLSVVQLPSVTATDWPRTDVDLFVLAGLEKEPLLPAPEADGRILVRRLYFLLVGLPPTPNQVATFVNDKHPDKLRYLVDRLLASPHFGECWGRHWLDLARYADSNGLDENFLFREAWRYRNWVIGAINADTPFDRFLLEQIAGDALPYANIQQRDRQRIAAGFLVVGPKVLLGNDAKKQRMEIADEQIDTIGRAVLGQTLGCARCHDHKFDPIPTADYYAMAGILTSTTVMETRYMLGQQRVMERLVGLGRRGGQFEAEYERYWLDRSQLLKKQKRAKSALEALKKGGADALKAVVEKHAEALTDVARDVEQPLAKRIESQGELVRTLDESIANPPNIPPRAMVPADIDEPADESIRVAGQFDRKSDRVPRGFLRVVNSNPSIKIPDGTSGRAELGRWLTDIENGAGCLAARVLANRIWYHLIGRGIVRTVDNFGRTGGSPSHPRLLDYLAAELIESDWSIKALIRKIVLSRTFAMSSKHHVGSYSIDPENRLLWRAHRRRLAPEALRDAMLAVGENLDLRPMESTVWYLGDQATAVGDNKIRRRTDFPCRSVYFPVIRNDLPEIFQVFDFADPHVTSGARPRTTVATQGLFMLNDQMVMDTSESMARKLLKAERSGKTEKVVDKMFPLILNVQPTDDERNELISFVQKTEKHLTNEGASEPTIRSWALAVQAIISASRFQFLE